MKNKWIPNGGKYTRPRRGYRAKSHYRDRLKRRGISTRDVRMESLDALRRKQGYISRPSDGIDRKGPTYKSLRRAYAGVQMPRGMPEMASDYSEEIWAESEEME